MSAAEKTTDEAGEPSWDLSFSAVKLKESASLGGDVRLEIAPRTTVLVGKNGAGKSLLLEKMHAALRGSSDVLRMAEPDSAYFACEVDGQPQSATTNSIKLRYECRWRRREARPETSRTSALPVTANADLKVEESCSLANDANQLLWRTDDGVVRYGNGGREEIAVGMTLLTWTISRGGRGAHLLPAVANDLANLFCSAISVPAGIPRGDGERDYLALPYPTPPRIHDPVETRRIRWLAYTLVHWHETDRALFDEFVALGRRVGLLDDVKVKLYRDPEETRTARSRDFATVLVDGTDFGLLSDGTLRVVEILVWLIFPKRKLLLIEEPETAVHPGLLSKLLAEIDAYSTDRQIVLSTRSPHVVSWADPRALRLVERHAGKTSVRSLREDEIGRVSAYLNDEGTLGDFVYSGALDG